MTILKLIITFVLALCACTGVSEPAVRHAIESEIEPEIVSEIEPAADVADASGAVAGGLLTVSFNYEKQSGSASNQFAVWIEDAGGNYIQTLYVTQWTANGGYKNRPDSISTWVRKSGLADMPKSEVDAISGATPKTGSFVYTWDLTDAEGREVPPGGYTVRAEGTLRWKNYVLFTGSFTIGDASVDFAVTPEYHYESSGNYAALSAESPENKMIGSVSAHFEPTLNGV